MNFAEVWPFAASFIAPCDPSFDPVVARRSVRVEPGLVAAFAAPLPPGFALESLRGQPGLDAPVKLALQLALQADMTARVIAELPRHRCDPSAANLEKTAIAALDSGLNSLSRLREESLGRGKAAGRGEASADPRANGHDWVSEIEEALEALPWNWTAAEEGSIRIHASGPGRAGLVRVELERTASGGLRASTQKTVRPGGAAARDAMALFALEINDRLRVARAGFVDSLEGSGAAARAVWDAVAPRSVPAPFAVAWLVDAVVFARLESDRAMAALATEPAARVYLDRFKPRKEDPKRRK